MRFKNVLTCYDKKIIVFFNSSKMLLLIVLVILITSGDGQIVGGPPHGKKIICYWASWAYYNPVRGQPRFQLGTVDPSLCTHIIYFNAFYDFEKNNIRTLDDWLDLQKDGGMGNFRGVTSLKDQNPHLKVMISVGDLSEGPLEFSKMAADPEIRKVFVQRVIRFLKNFRFDGLDFNWLFPTKKGGAPHDRENFVLVAKELSEAFKPLGFILAATIGTQESTMEAAYDLVKLSHYLDMIHMRSWNYHDAGDQFVGASAPMKGVNADDNLSVEFSVNYVLSHGVPPHKLILGLAYHGRTYFLTDPQITAVQFGTTPSKSEGFKGPYSKLKGYMDYLEICLELSNTTSYRYYWDQNTSTPYLRDGDKVICYENARSLVKKVWLSVQKDFGGLLLWTIDADDYLGICSPESHYEAEAYMDIIDRLNTINNDQILGEALQSLNIIDETRVNTASATPSYVTSNGKLKLYVPKTDKPEKFKMTKFVNGITSLALVEKEILDTIERIKLHKGVITKVEFTTSTPIATNTRATAKRKYLPSDFKL